MMSPRKHAPSPLIARLLLTALLLPSGPVFSLTPPPRPADEPAVGDQVLAAVGEAMAELGEEISCRLAQIVAGTQALAKTGGTAAPATPPLTDLREGELLALPQPPGATVLSVEKSAEPAARAFSLAAPQAAVRVVLVFNLLPVGWQPSNPVPASVLQPIARAVGKVYGYDAVGNRESLTHANGVVTTYTYDTLNRLRDVTAINAVGAIITNFAYTLGPAGNRTKIVELDGTTKSYVYDDLYRLTGETVTLNGATSWSNSFGYDPVGNRLAQNRVEVGGATRNVAYGYDSRDRLITEDTLNYGWDQNGNLISKSGTDGATYEWDYENRLRKATLADGTTVEHSYDVDGTRVKTVTTPPGGPAETVEYLVDTSGALSQVVLEGPSTTEVTVYYVRGDDLISVIRPQAGGSSVVRSYHADGLGSIRALTDEAGVVTDTWQFEAFGELMEHAGSVPNVYLFAGEMLDPNVGWYYNRARWMDPGVGRFAGIDPFGGSAVEPESLHKYLYASVEPVASVDPSGLFTGGISELSVVNAIRTEITLIQLDVFLGAGASADKSDGIARINTIFSLLTGGIALVTLIAGIVRYGPRAAKSVINFLKDAKRAGRLRQLFTRQEAAVVMEARAIFNSDGMDALRKAFRRSEGSNVMIGSRPIQYEPDFRDFGMTNREAGGFLLGARALESEEELAKTVLWELHRLEFGTPYGAGVSGAASAAEFDAARSFSEKAFKEVLDAVE